MKTLGPYKKDATERAEKLLSALEFLSSLKKIKSTVWWQQRVALPDIMYGAQNNAI